MNDVVTIGCKNGHVFSACTTDEAKGVEWYAQVGYYAQQGCQINKAKHGEWKFAKPDEKCEECEKIEHDVSQYEIEEED